LDLLSNFWGAVQFCQLFFEVCAKSVAAVGLVSARFCAQLFLRQFCVLGRVRAARLFQKSSGFLRRRPVERLAARTNGRNAEKAQPTRRVRLWQVPLYAPVKKPKSPAVHLRTSAGLAIFRFGRAVNGRFWAAA
jgi:hypothetical protein